MRVAFLTSAWGPEDGMLGRNVQAHARAIAAYAENVTVLVHGVRSAVLTQSEERIEVVHIPHLKPHSGLAPASGLRAYARRGEDGFDVLHVHGRPTLPMLRTAAHAASRVIFSPHYYARAPQKLRQLAQGRAALLDRKLLGSAAAVLCVSHAEALQVRRFAPEAHVQVIPNGIDRDSIAAARCVPVAGRMIITADSLTRWTGIHRIISALPALSPAYRLTVIGDGRGRGALEEHAEYVRVSRRVSFVGAVEEAELHRWLRRASVMAMLQEESLWGGTLLAAAAAGVPVVASDITAYREAATLAGREVVPLAGRDGVTFVSRRASPFAIAAAISNSALAGSRPCPERVPTWQDAAEHTMGVYQDVVAPLRAA